MENIRPLFFSDGPNLTDELLRGAIDMHHHGYPEISLDIKPRYEDVDELVLARSAGMAGIVLKSHMWPTVGRAYHLSRLVPGITVYPSITLNPVVGGFSPLAIESAALQGAAAVFMPTWGAAHDFSRGGMSKRLNAWLKHKVREEDTLTVTDSSGKIKPEVAECLAVAAEHGMAILTGHVSPRESIALAARAKDFGIDSVVFQHPDSNSVGATREEIREIAALGATIEICGLGMLPLYQRISPKEALQIIEDVTPAQAILTTDYFWGWVPSAPETLRMMIGAFLELGMSASDVRAMVSGNPARLLSGSKAATALVAETRLAAE